jgi:hypothetical protein
MEGESVVLLWLLASTNIALLDTGAVTADTKQNAQLIVSPRFNKENDCVLSYCWCTRPGKLGNCTGNRRVA